MRAYIFEDNTVPGFLIEKILHAEKGVEWDIKWFKNSNDYSLIDFSEKFFIFADINLLDGSFLDVAPLITSSPMFKKKKHVIFFISGEDCPDFYKRGAVECFKKPVHVADIQTCIKKHLYFMQELKC